MTAKKFLGREAILAVPDIQTEELYVPEWDCWVRVRGLSGAQRDQFEMASLVKKGRDQEVNRRLFRARLVALSVVDEKGNRLFSDADAQGLGEKSAAALERIFDVASRLSGLSATDVDELTKNSESGQSADSTSASLWPSAA